MSEEPGEAPSAEQAEAEAAQNAGDTAIDTAEHNEAEVAADDQGDGGEGTGEERGGEEEAGIGAEEDGGGEDKDDEREDEDAVLAQRDKLIKLASRLTEADPADIAAVRAILDALMSKWDNIEVPQIVLGAEQSLGMIVRRLRKNDDDELATQATRLYDMYRSE